MPEIDRPIPPDPLEVLARERLRREQSQALAVNFLQQFNPRLSDERIKEVLFSGGDILRLGSFKSIFDSLAGKAQGNLSKWVNAVELARYYYQNDDLPIPARAVVFHQGISPQSVLSADEKALVVITHNAFQVSKAGVVVNFPNSETHLVREGLRFKARASTLKSPDLFLIDYKGTYNKEHRSLPGKLSGVNGVLMSGYFSDSTSLLDLECSGRVGILPGYYQNSDRGDGSSRTRVRDVRIKTGAEIVQYGGTVQVEQIQCRDYILNEGELKNGRANGQKGSLICLGGHFINRGGMVDSLNLDISDADTERQVQERLATYRNEIGDDTSATQALTETQPINTQVTSIQRETPVARIRELEEKFIADFPVVDHRTEFIDGRWVFARAYQLEINPTDPSSMKRYLEFILRSREAGYSIYDKTEVDSGQGKTVLITLVK